MFLIFSYLTKLFMSNMIKMCNLFCNTIFFIIQKKNFFFQKYLTWKIAILIKQNNQLILNYTLKSVIGMTSVFLII